MKWPTLQDRLKHPLKTEEEALRQLKAFNVAMSEEAKAKLKQYDERPTLNPTDSQEVSNPLD